MIEPMEILITSKGSIDIVYKGKKARFYGELGISGFRAVTGSMRRMEPVKDAPASEEEREEWINAIMKLGIVQEFNNAKEFEYICRKHLFKFFNEKTECYEKNPFITRPNNLVIVETRKNLKGWRKY